LKENFIAERGDINLKIVYPGLIIFDEKKHGMKIWLYAGTSENLRLLFHRTSAHKAFKLQEK